MLAGALPPSASAALLERVDTIVADVLRVTLARGRDQTEQQRSVREYMACGGGGGDTWGQHLQNGDGGVAKQKSSATSRRSSDAVVSALLSQSICGGIDESWRDLSARAWRYQGDDPEPCESQRRKEMRTWLYLMNLSPHTTEFSSKIQRVSSVNPLANQ